ncbi:uncharacterized protein LOC136032292 isoform X2 [Artemia franciscana]|uniref:Uncharacterized protein n=1 Tax=Artemia franciscana TaxID=6661 RepID=A0AA88LG79_ARTSF|nr:hypothetical protein QYM36_000259 [Artemia franciscana]
MNSQVSLPLMSNKVVEHVVGSVLEDERGHQNLSLPINATNGRCPSWSKFENVSQDSCWGYEDRGDNTFRIAMALLKLQDSNSFPSTPSPSSTDSGRFSFTPPPRDLDFYRCVPPPQAGSVRATPFLASPVDPNFSYPARADVHQSGTESQEFEKSKESFIRTPGMKLYPYPTPPSVEELIVQASERFKLSSIPVHPQLNQKFESLVNLCHGRIKETEEEAVKVASIINEVSIGKMVTFLKTFSASGFARSSQTGIEALLSNLETFYVSMVPFLKELEDVVKSVCGTNTADSTLSIIKNFQTAFINLQKYRILEKHSTNQKSKKKYFVSAEAMQNYCPYLEDMATSLHILFSSIRGSYEELRFKLDILRNSEAFLVEDGLSSSDENSLFFNPFKRV